MIKRIIAKTVLYQIILMVLNLLISIMVTRDLSILDKSGQAYINLLCGAGIILFNQHSIDKRITNQNFQKYTSPNLVTTGYLLFGIFLYATLRSDLTSYLLALLYFSLSLLNSSGLNEFLKTWGIIQTQKLRVTYSSGLLAVIFGIHYFWTLNIHNWLFTFVLLETVLLIYLLCYKKITLLKYLSRFIGFKARKLQLSTSYFASISSNLIETVAIISLGLIADRQTLAFLSVGLSITSFVTVPYFALQSRLLKYADYLYLRLLRRRYQLLLLCSLATIIISQYLLRSVYEWLVTAVFGLNYKEFAIHSYIVMIAGIILLCSKSLNTVLRGIGKLKISLISSLGTLTVLLVPLFTKSAINQSVIAIVVIAIVPLLILILSMFKCVNCWPIARKIIE